MGKIVAVLLVPADGDPGGLLAAGRCSLATPACCSEYGRAGWMVGLWPASAALPLWWDGALVPEGWDRLQREVHREAQPLTWHMWRPRLARVLVEAETAVCVGLASRVVRLVHLDGRLVEMAEDSGRDPRGGGE
jgi:hypothetical protein